MSEEATPSRVWPTGVDYSRAVQEGAERLDSSFRYAEGLLGSPQTAHGRHAIVFRFDHDSEPSVALRCFTQAHPEAEHRYRAFDEHLRRHPIAAFPAVGWLDDAIDVNGDVWPALRMEWIHGLRLDRWIDGRVAAGDTDAIADMAEQWRAVARDVAAAGVGHGDYQHGNILIDEEGQIRIVDLDGLWVPALADAPSDECGHESYQHPGRASNEVWHADVDGFSALVVWLSLRAIAAAPRLWSTRDTHDEHLVLSNEHLENPDAPIWGELAAADDDVGALVERVQVMLRAAADALPGVDVSLADPDVALDLPLAPCPVRGDRTSDGGVSPATAGREIDTGATLSPVPGRRHLARRLAAFAAAMLMLVVGVTSTGGNASDGTDEELAGPLGGSTPSTLLGDELIRDKADGAESVPEERTVDDAVSPEASDDQPISVAPTDEIPDHLESEPIEEAEAPSDDDGDVVNPPPADSSIVTPPTTRAPAPPTTQAPRPPTTTRAAPPIVTTTTTTMTTTTTTTTTTTVPPAPALRAVISAPTLALDVGQSVTFDGRGSTGDPDSYLWDWGYRGRTTSGATAGYGWPEAGTFTVTLTVTRSGERHMATATVVVTAPGVVVPNVVGMSRSAAEAAIESAGLEPFARPVRSARPRYEVVAQGAASGTTVEPGSRVTINVSDSPFCDENPSWGSCAQAVLQTQD